MRCTECSKVVKPVVALDIDGTLGDYHGHFLAFARGWLPAPYLPTDDFSENCGLDIETWRKVKLAYRQGGMKRTMRAYPYASELTQMIREEGAEIWITTTRPYNRLDNIDPDTQEWLRRNGVLWDHVIYDPDKYEQLAQLVDPDRVVAVLEDLPAQCDRAAKLFGQRAVLLRNNGYTSQYLPGVRNLQDAAKEIYTRIGEWNG